MLLNTNRSFHLSNLLHTGGSCNEAVAHLVLQDSNKSSAYINLQVLFSHMDKEKHAIVPGIKMPFLSHTIKHLFSAVSLHKDHEREEKRANRKKED